MLCLHLLTFRHIDDIMHLMEIYIVRRVKYMTINYICDGFDKDFYNFDAVVVPVVKWHNSKNELTVRGFREDFLKDFRNDFHEIIQGLPISAFKPDRTKTVKSEKTGIHYIFIMIYPIEGKSDLMRRKILTILDDKNYSYCCEKIAERINELDVKNILIHPALNKADFNHNTDSDFLAKTLKSNIGRFSKKNIYIFVKISGIIDHKVANAFFYMQRGIITPEECKKIYAESEMEKSLSYTNSLVKTAEIETVYNKKTVIEQFREDMKNDSWFFDEYINKYQGTASKLAENAGIDKSTISTIKKHKYKEKSRKVIIALAIALDLTVDDRKRFINSAGFSYPITEHDRFIEQQLKKKRYNSVTAFNKDIMDKYPDFVIGTRALKGYQKEDK